MRQSSQRARAPGIGPLHALCAAAVKTSVCGGAAPRPTARHTGRPPTCFLLHSVFNSTSAAPTAAHARQLCHAQEPGTQGSSNLLFRCTVAAAAARSAPAKAKTEKGGYRSDRVQKYHYGRPSAGAAAADIAKCILWAHHPRRQPLWVKSRAKQQPLGCGKVKPAPRRLRPFMRPAASPGSVSRSNSGAPRMRACKAGRGYAAGGRTCAARGWARTHLLSRAAAARLRPSKTGTEARRLRGGAAAGPPATRRRRQGAGSSTVFGWEPRGG